MQKITSAFLIVVLMIFGASSPVMAQEKDDGPNIIQLRKGRHLFLNNDVRGALREYEDLYRSYPADPTVNFRLGECHMALRNTEQALPFLETAYKAKKDEDEELAYLLGKAYHQLGKLDQAEEIFSAIMSDEEQSTENVLDAEVFKRQIASARTMMANPIPVKIVNLGERVNSNFDEYAPSVSADGKTLTFTSRRPDTKGGGVDPNDSKFYEDIYISQWNEDENAWSLAASAPGRLNTEFHDASLSISPDGRQIFLYKNIDPKKSGDIYVSKINMQGNWATPQPLPKTINSSYFESSAALSSDGKWLYFVSERKGGHGMGDIYRSKRISRSEWGEAENLGSAINTPEDEISVFLHPDGKTLFFSSKGHSTMGGYDIFKTVFENGKWSDPQNLGYPINSLGDDLHFTLSADNMTAFYSNVREGGMGGRDIYQVDFSEYAIMEPDGKYKKGSGLSILKGNIIDSDAAQAVEVDITIKDGEGNVISSTSSNTEGEYFVTLTGGKDYFLSINLPGFENVNEKIFLPVDELGTYTLVKHFIVDRKSGSLKSNEE